MQKIGHNLLPKYPVGYIQKGCVQACICICWIGTVRGLAEGTHMPLGNSLWWHGVAEQGAWGGASLLYS